MALKASLEVTRKLTALVYYAIDKASPYPLAMSPQTGELAQIKDYPLARLGITEHGLAIMWLWINAHCQPDAKPVSPDIASECKLVSDVMAAVLKNVA